MHAEQLTYVAILLAANPTVTKGQPPSTDPCVGIGLETHDHPLRSGPADCSVTCPPSPNGFDQKYLKYCFKNCPKNTACFQWILEQCSASTSDSFYHPPTDSTQTCAGSDFCSATNFTIFCLDNCPNLRACISNKYSNLQTTTTVDTVDSDDPDEPTRAALTAQTTTTRTTQLVATTTFTVDDSTTPITLTMQKIDGYRITIVVVVPLGTVLAAVCFVLCIRTKISGARRRRQRADKSENGDSESLRGEMLDPGFHGNISGSSSSDVSHVTVDAESTDDAAPDTSASATPLLPRSTANAYSDPGSGILNSQTEVKELFNDGPGVPSLISLREDSTGHSQVSADMIPIPCSDDRLEVGSKTEAVEETDDRPSQWNWKKMDGQ